MICSVRIPLDEMITTRLSDLTDDMSSDTNKIKLKVRWHFSVSVSFNYVSIVKSLRDFIYYVTFLVKL